MNVDSTRAQLNLTGAAGSSLAMHSRKKSWQYGITPRATMLGRILAFRAAFSRSQSLAVSKVWAITQCENGASNFIA